MASLQEENDTFSGGKVFMLPSGEAMIGVETPDGLVLQSLGEDMASKTELALEDMLMAAPVKTSDGEVLLPTTAVTEPLSEEAVMQLISKMYGSGRTVVLQTDTGEQNLVTLPSTTEACKTELIVSADDVFVSPICGDEQPTISSSDTVLIPSACTTEIVHAPEDMLVMPTDNESVDEVTCETEENEMMVETQIIEPVTEEVFIPTACKTEEITSETSDDVYIPTGTQEVFLTNGAKTEDVTSVSDSVFASTNEPISSVADGIFATTTCKAEVVPSASEDIFIPSACKREVDSPMPENIFDTSDNADVKEESEMETIIIKPDAHGFLPGIKTEIIQSVETVKEESGSDDASTPSRPRRSCGLPSYMSAYVLEGEVDNSDVIAGTNKLQFTLTDDLSKPTRMHIQHNSGIKTVNLPSPAPVPAKPSSVKKASKPKKISESAVKKTNKPKAHLQQQHQETVSKKKAKVKDTSLLPVNRNAKSKPQTSVQQAKTTKQTAPATKRTTHKITFICDICTKVCVSSSSLQQHMAAAHMTNQPRPFRCEFCPKAFGQRSTLLTHRRLHTGERPFSCKHCPRSFSDHSTLVKHVRTHTGEQPYVCEVCNRGFSQSGNLYRHQKSRNCGYQN